MNPKIKTCLLALSLLPIFIACNNKSKDNSNTESTATKTVDEHAHTFACPMHPEVTGKEGDNCPKCGMKLEHNDGVATAAGTYYMQFTSNPATIEQNKQVTLSVTPKKKDADGDQVALDVEHEKKIHFILVSDDLSWFDQIHPEYTSDGSYKVDTKFPAPGKYKAFADYKPTGGSHVVDKIDIAVSGTPAVAKKFTAEKLTGSTGKYSFELKPEGGKLVTGSPLNILGILKKDGKEIDANTLDNYLGAKGHFVLISLNEKEYLHVHPGVENGRFDLHTTIEKPGTYRGWIQFNGGNDKIETIDFTWLVTKGTNTTSTSKGGSEEHH